MSRSLLAKVSFDALHAADSLKSQAFHAFPAMSHFGQSLSESWLDRFSGWGSRGRQDAPPAGGRSSTDTDDARQQPEAAIEGHAKIVAALGLGEANPGAADLEAPADVIRNLLLGDGFRLNASQPLGSAASVTYAFLEAVPGYYESYDWAHDDFRPFSVQQQEMTRGALAMIGSYSNLTFVETAADAAAVTFGIADLPRGWSGYAYYPVGATVERKAADVWIDTEWAGTAFTPGTGTYKTLLHEIGHVLGLDHPHARSGPLSASVDSRMYTVMSYNRHPDASGEPQSHMLHDIAAVQHIYGANSEGSMGNDVYAVAALGDRIQTLWDAGGNDTLDLSEAPFAVTLDLRQGAFSTVAESGRNTLAIAYGTTIENAFGGAGDDLLIGNAAGNRLGGGPGNDVLTGGGGGNVFVVGPDWGHDSITDFTRGADRLELWDTNLAFADLEIVTAGNGTRVVHDDNQITLPGVNDLGQSDFLFGQTTLLA